MRDPIFLSVVADFFINLAAGWFAASIVFSPIIRPGKRFNFWVLTVNIMSAILSLIVAFKLRKSL